MKTDIDKWASDTLAKAIDRRIDQVQWELQLHDSELARMEQVKEPPFSSDADIAAKHNYMDVLLDLRRALEYRHEEAREGHCSIHTQVLPPLMLGTIGFRHTEQFKIVLDDLAVAIRERDDTTDTWRGAEARDILWNRKRAIGSLGFEVMYESEDAVSLLADKETIEECAYDFEAGYNRLLLALHMEGGGG